MGETAVADKKAQHDFVRIDPMKVQPLDCRLLVRKMDCGDTSEGGIILPHGADNNRQLTLVEVIRVGDGRTTDKGVHIDVRPNEGDHVLIGKFAGSQVGQGDEYRIINEVEILGVHKKE